MSGCPAVTIALLTLRSYLLLVSPNQSPSVGLRSRPHFRNREFLEQLPTFTVGPQAPKHLIIPKNEQINLLIIIFAKNYE